MLERRDEFRVQAEQALDKLKKGHGTESTAIAAALCAIAWNQLQPVGEQVEIDLEADPYAIERALKREPNCKHETGGMPVCKLCGWDVVREAWPE
jgi:hypothetical protein